VRHRSWALASLGAVAAAVAAIAIALPAASTPSGAAVSITVNHLRNERGIVQACLTAMAQHFPDCRADPAARHMSVTARNDMVLEFTDVPPGTYAIALVHDENGNGRVDRVLMIPREGFGFSRDAPVRMGPPSFDAAAFHVGSGAVSQTIRMRYLL
jgi:uncharacterized protein (DUF2141 family)